MSGQSPKLLAKEAQAAGKTRISLIDDEKLLDLLIAHKIGITADQYTVYSLDEEWWGDVAGETDLPPPSARPSAPSVIYPLTIQATAHNQSYQAELLDAGGRVRFNSAEYQSPSGACQAASGWKSCNGWTFWRYQHPETGVWRVIDELRVKAGRK